MTVYTHTAIHTALARISGQDAGGPFPRLILLDKKPVVHKKTLQNSDMAGMNLGVQQPSPLTTINQGTARPTLREGPISADTASFVNGPERFSGATVNPQTTTKVKVTRLDEEGINSLEDMHEHAWLWALNMPHRADFPHQVVVITTQQLNTFLEVMHRRALSMWRQAKKDDNISQLNESTIRRLSRQPATEILKFMDKRFLVEFVHFLGVQFGNRYLDPASGPGLAVITSGTALARNMCLNDTAEQDELWFLLRRRTPSSPLSVVMQSYSRHGGPRLADLAYKDLSGSENRGVAWKVGFIAHKPNKDAREERRRVALGLEGTSEQAVMAELQLPLFRVVVTNCGPKAIQI